MNNLFRLNGKLRVLLAYYILVTIILTLASLYLYSRATIFNTHPAFRIGAYVWIIGVSIVFICYVLRYLTYGIKLEGNTLSEFGMFLKNPRVIQLSSIQQIYTQIFSNRGLFSTGKRGQLLLIPYFNLTNDKVNPFPLYPINPDLVEQIQKSNPQVAIDTHIEELVNKYRNSFFMQWQYYESYITVILAAVVIAFLPVVPYVIYTNLIPALTQQF